MKPWNYFVPVNHNQSMSERRSQYHERKVSTALFSNHERKKSSAHCISHNERKKRAQKFFQENHFFATVKDKLKENMIFQRICITITNLNLHRIRI